MRQGRGRGEPRGGVAHGRRAGRWLVASGRDDGRADRAEGPPPGLRPGPLVVAEPVEDASVAQRAEPDAGTTDRAEREGGDLLRGQGAVVVEEVEQVAVAVGEAGQFVDDDRRQADGGDAGSATRSDSPYQLAPVHRSSSSSSTCGYGVFKGACSPERSPSMGDTGERSREPAPCPAGVGKVLTPIRLWGTGLSSSGSVELSVRASASSRRRVRCDRPVWLRAALRSASARPGWGCGGGMVSAVTGRTARPAEMGRRTT